MIVALTYLLTYNYKKFTPDCSDPKKLDVILLYKGLGSVLHRNEV